MKGTAASQAHPPIFGGSIFSNDRPDSATYAYPAIPVTLRRLPP